MTALFIAGALAMVISLIATRVTIRIFGRIGRGQPILGKEDRGPEHQHKAGTPTMGGIAILGSAVLAYLLTHLREGVVFSDQVLIMIVGIAVLAFLGFLDDFVKVRRARNRGIFWKTKGWLVLGVSAAIALWLGLATNVKTTLSFTRWDYPGWELPLWLWVIWATVIIFATTHAVNVTDGLDGLAAGTSLFGFIAFTVIAFWGFRNPDIYEIVNPLDLAVLAVALAGACAGFLWWNAAPARIFMGDVGALGIGASLGMLAVTSNTQLLLPIIAGLQVMEIGSVALQMGTYRLSGRTRRLFKIAPIHHHFELIGWPETTVIIRFWVISGICVAAALALYYADWLTAAGLR
jgi:phospho-N-acetylmuramoyl-pentapeptide-transferase